MTIINSIWNFICDMGKASYAAHLARNGKWHEAQQAYKK